jgi:hypothetical protein
LKSRTEKRLGWKGKLLKSRTEKMIEAAQAYDYEHKGKLGSWSRVPDIQVLRLLIGAGLIKAADADA